MRTILCTFLALLLGCAEPTTLVPGDGRLAVEGGSIFYRVVGSGSGTPVILLHGGPGYTSEYLEPLTATMKRDRRPWNASRAQFQMPR